MWQDIRIPLLLTILTGVTGTAFKIPRVFRKSLFPVLLNVWLAISVIVGTWGMAVDFTQQKLQPFLATQTVALAREAVGELQLFGPLSWMIFSNAGVIYLLAMLWLAEKIEEDQK